MIKIVIATILIGLSTNLFAKDEALKMKFCEAITKYAETVMHKRQNGGKAIDSIKNIEKNMPNPTLKGFYIAMVKDAYKQPLWASEEKKREAEIEFSNEISLICLDNF